MKLTSEELARLNTLSKKGKDDLSDAEKSELSKLQKKAQESKAYDFNEETKQYSEKKADDGDSITIDTLKSTIVDAVKAATDENKVTEDKIKSIVDKALKDNAPQDNHYNNDVVKQIMTVAIQEAGKIQASKSVIIDNIDFKGIFTDVTKENIKSKSKMAFEIPVGDTKGNLSVADRQILNVTTGKAMNEGIPESSLRKAQVNGERELQSLKRKASHGFHLIDKAAHLEEQMSKGATIQAEAVREILEQAGAIQKAISTTSISNFIDRDLSSDMFQRMFLDSLLARRFMANEVQMPTDPYDYPISTTRMSWFQTAEAQDAIASDPGNGQLTLASKKFTGYTILNYEAEEDSIIPVLPYLREQIGISGVETYENALINGDTTATHQDSDTHAVTRHANKNWNGFRKLAIAGSCVVNLATDSISKAGMRSLRKFMKKYGLRPSQLVWLAGVNGVNDLMGISEVYTKDKFSSPVLERGEISFYENIPVLPSEFVREDLNASGVFDNTTTTKGSIMLIFVPGFITGSKRNFMLEMDKDIVGQKRWLVASYRKAFSPVEAPSATIPTVAMGYNYNA